MTNVSWKLQGREFIHCNCAYGCPCQFNALPTHGQCHAIGAIDIEDEVSWRHPSRRAEDQVDRRLARRAIHEGGGQCVPIVDERATPQQREALLRIMSGEDTEPGATFFAVFAAHLRSPSRAGLHPDRLYSRRQTAERRASKIPELDRCPGRTDPQSGNRPEHRARIHPAARLRIRRLRGRARLGGDEGADRAVARR